VTRHRRGGGRAYLERDGQIIEANGATETPIVEVALVPITIGGLARHNVANALAAAGGARGLGATIEQVRDGLIHFAPSAESSPGRLNLFRLGPKVVIVDFAHNEAGIGAVLDVAQGSPAGRPDGPHRSPRSSAPPGTGPTTPCAGSAGSPPSERSGRYQADAQVPARTDRGVGRRGADGRRRGRWVSATDVPIYDSETVALQAELNGAAGAGANGGRSDAAGSSC
jgi:cyanophycin synthetase